MAGNLVIIIVAANIPSVFNALACHVVFAIAADAVLPVRRARRQAGFVGPFRVGLLAALVLMQRVGRVWVGRAAVLDRCFRPGVVWRACMARDLVVVVIAADVPSVLDALAGHIIVSVAADAVLPVW